jgi:hypothetical protein
MCFCLTSYSSNEEEPLSARLLKNSTLKIKSVVLLSIRPKNLPQRKTVPKLCQTPSKPLLKSVAWNIPDPERRQQWRKIPCVGEIPTQEEWLKYAVEFLTAEEREDLLRWYPNL